MADMPRVRVVNKSNKPEPGVMPGFRTKVYIDDVDISACLESVRVDARVKGPVTATLTVYVNELDLDDDMVLQLGPGAPDLLIKHGWVPPLSDRDRSAA